jgi:predicted aminopeptidase
LARFLKSKTEVFKKALLFFIGVIILLVVIYFDLLRYGINQGIGQINIIIKSRPVEEVLVDSTVSDDLKNKLRLVEEIRRYSILELGLDNSKNYTTMYDQQGKPVLWVVRACQPFKLENFEWTFPVVGTVSYKGYFDLDKAIALRDELKQAGYDTYIREVSAWSTLGWFKDPILSEMLNEPPGDLANTIIHELTHATIFVRDSITFNENLASFIGDRGAEKFLVYQYPESEELENYRQLKADRGAYARHFLNGAKYLDSLYNTFSVAEDTLFMQEKKNEAIQLVVDKLDTIDFYNPSYGRRFQEYLPNNAYFMSYLLYRSGQASLDSIFKENYSSDLSLFISEMKKLHPK